MRESAWWAGQVRPKERLVVGWADYDDKQRSSQVRGVATCKEEGREVYKYGQPCFQHQAHLTQGVASQPMVWRKVPGLSCDRARHCAHGSANSLRGFELAGTKRSFITAHIDEGSSKEESQRQLRQSRVRVDNFGRFKARLCMAPPKRLCSYPGGCSRY
jgi:hypothetical protein